MKAEVKAESKSSTRVEVKARDHSFEIDEPEAHGGTGAAPNPVEYELGALTGCINVTLHTVADEMDVEVEDLTVEISGELNPAKFQGKDTEERAGFKQIDVEVDIESDADQETLERLVEEVEERCPVRDNLCNETPVRMKM
ncbi:MAG: OsmC family protein [Candidatus Nanohalobium sp.]